MWASWFCRQIFVSHDQKTSQGVPSVFQILYGIEKVILVRDKVGVSRFSVENFMSQCQNIGGRTLQCFRKLRVAENFVHKKRFSSISNDYILSHNAEKLRGVPSNVSKNFEYWKKLCIGRRWHFSPLKFFCLTVLKIFVQEPFCVSKISGFDDFYVFMCRKGGASRYCGKKLCLKGLKRKTLYGSCLVLQKILVSKQFYG